MASDDEVVIRHQAVFVETPTKRLDAFARIREKLQPVTILPENVLPFIASGCDVPEGTFEFKSQRS
jgi:hypothetical protein